jgi:hypothetical protein
VSQSQNTSQASKSANVRSYLTALEVNLIGKIEEGRTIAVAAG